MATDYNINIKRYNGTDYDTLYPKTKIEQVVDGQYKVTTSVVQLKNWGGNDPYYLTIMIGVSPMLQVNINPTVEQLTALTDAGVTSMVAVNKDGTVTLWATGASPGEMSLQVTKIMTYN